MINSFSKSQFAARSETARVSEFSGVGSHVGGYKKPDSDFGGGVQGKSRMGESYGVAGNRHTYEQMISTLSETLLALKLLLDKGGLPVDGVVSRENSNFRPAEKNIKKDASPENLSGRRQVGLSGKTTGERPDNIWNGVMFSQENNEPTLSAIKAAMMRFGQSPLGVYASVKPTREGYDIVMRDGFKLSLTLKEIGRTKAVAGFQHGASLEDGGMHKDVVFMYAASAKRAQLESGGGERMSFAQGFEAMLSNQAPEFSLKRLGVAEHMRRTTWAELKNSGGIGVVAGANTNFAFEGMLDGCIKKHSLPLSHGGETYELV